MEFLINQLFEKVEAKYLHERLLTDLPDWLDGKETAGSHAKGVKNNYQLDRNSHIAEELSGEIIKKIQQNALIKSFSLPKKIHGLTFSKSVIGQGYGTHIDNPYMSSGRSDLSFTLFLSPPETYEGGELMIQTLQKSEVIKLPAGQIVVYPSTYLHSVEKVTSGQRIVCVGWIHSYVSNVEDRNLLFGLDAGARGLLAKNGRTSELDLVFQAYSNLLRRLGE